MLATTHTFKYLAVNGLRRMKLEIYVLDKILALSVRIGSTYISCVIFFRHVPGGLTLEGAEAKSTWFSCHSPEKEKIYDEKYMSVRLINFIALVLHKECFCRAPYFYPCTIMSWWL